MTREWLPDYVVIRPGVGLPDGFLPADLDGRWYDRATIPTVWRPDGPTEGAVAVPAGRFEYREDGAVAEVWEVRP
jgi:hypothetical protein